VVLTITICDESSGGPRNPHLSRPIAAIVPHHDSPTQIQNVGKLAHEAACWCVPGKPSVTSSLPPEFPSQFRRAAESYGSSLWGTYHLP